MALALPPSQQKKYKLVLLGESGVGKSSLVLRLVKDEWMESQHSTVGASFFRCSCTVDEQTVNFDIWDTAGQERYKSLASMYYRGAAAAVVVYDITSSDSLERAKYWIRELMANSPETIVALVGNKCDLENLRKVYPEEAETYAKEMNLLFSEASAKEGTKVMPILTGLARKLTANTTATAVKDGGVIGANQRKQPKKGGGCCN
eukprot:GFYU01045715.1.p1 GENE.GFYU01045715.1~~GFYU01045715.1.p1  ORF type:complete len:231 (+),score=23.61 GFYU01045715.1:82-693(+)